MSNMRKKREAEKTLSNWMSLHLCDASLDVVKQDWILLTALSFSLMPHVDLPAMFKREVCEDSLASGGNTHLISRKKN